MKIPFYKKVIKNSLFLEFHQKVMYFIKKSVLFFKGFDIRRAFGSGFGNLS